MRPTPIFLVALLFVPTVAFAKVCYSPSDCSGMEHCTSLDDGTVPGRCTTDARIIQKVKIVLPPAPKKPTPKASSSSASKASSSSSITSSSSVSSSSSSMMSSSSSSSAPSAGVISGMLTSLMNSLKSMMNSFSSMMNSMKCMFGGCKA